MIDYNPFLNPGQKPPTAAAGTGKIERPSDIQNLPWQTRPAPPTEYEVLLTNALEQIFGEGIHGLSGIVGRLNEVGMRDPSGSAWTAEGFQREMARLGQ